MHEQQPRGLVSYVFWQGMQSLGAAARAFVYHVIVYKHHVFAKHSPAWFTCVTLKIFCILTLKTFCIQGSTRADGNKYQQVNGQGENV
jgi:hypothetical protein